MKSKRQYKCSGCHQNHKPKGRNCAFLAAAAPDDEDLQSDEDLQMDALNYAVDDAEQEATSDEEQAS